MADPADAAKAAILPVAALPAAVDRDVLRAADRADHQAVIPEAEDRQAETQAANHAAAADNRFQLYR